MNIRVLPKSIEKRLRLGVHFIVSEKSTTIKPANRRIGEMTVHTAIVTHGSMTEIVLGRASLVLIRL